MLRITVSFVACFILALLGTALIFGANENGILETLSVMAMASPYVLLWYLVAGLPTAFFLVRFRGRIKFGMLTVVAVLPFALVAFVLRVLSAIHYSDPFVMFLNQIIVKLCALSGLVVLTFWYSSGLNKSSPIAQ